MFHATVLTERIQDGSHAPNAKYSAPHPPQRAIFAYSVTNMGFLPSTVPVIYTTNLTHHADTPSELGYSLHHHSYY